MNGERWIEEVPTHPRKISHAQVIALPHAEPVTEWIVAGLAVVLLLAGLVS